MEVETAWWARGTGPWRCSPGMGWWVTRVWMLGDEVWAAHTRGEVVLLPSGREYDVSDWVLCSSESDGRGFWVLDGLSEERAMDRLDDYEVLVFSGDHLPRALAERTSGWLLEGTVSPIAIGPSGTLLQDLPRLGVPEVEVQLRQAHARPPRHLLQYALRLKVPPLRQSPRPLQ